LIEGGRLGCIRAPTGGRVWWAHFEFTRINISPTILRKKIEDLMNVKGIGEKSFLKLKPLITVGVDKGERAGGAR
jgi:hypothetical protein